MIKRRFGEGEDDSVSNAKRLRQFGVGRVESDHLLGHHCGFQVQQWAAGDMLTGCLFFSLTGSIINRIYVAVNESALLSTATADGDVYEATWLRERKKLLQLKDKNVKYYVNKSQCRCKLFLNGTLQIERVVKEDSGNYTVTVYRQDGKLKAEQDTILTVLGEFSLFPYHSQLS